MRIWENGIYRDATVAEEAAFWEDMKPTAGEELASLKAELAAYDYIGVKLAMGVATREEYARQIAYTERLRCRIRELEETEKERVIHEQ